MARKLVTSVADTSAQIPYCSDPRLPFVVPRKLPQGDIGIGEKEHGFLAQFHTHNGNGDNNGQDAGKEKQGLDDAFTPP